MSIRAGHSTRGLNSEGGSSFRGTRWDLMEVAASPQCPSTDNTDPGQAGLLGFNTKRLCRNSSHLLFTQNRWDIVQSETLEVMPARHHFIIKLCLDAPLDQAHRTTLAGTARKTDSIKTPRRRAAPQPGSSGRVPGAAGGSSTTTLNLPFCTWSSARNRGLRKIRHHHRV